MPLINRLADYRATVVQAQALITASHALTPAGASLWTLDQRRVITHAGFLQFFIGWETFLEGSLNDYMMGELSGIGTTIPRWVLPPTADHATSILIGTQKYVDYTNPEIVRRLAKLYLDTGRPFDPVLASIHTDLFDLKTIRNAAAHLSSTTSSQLDALSTRKLGIQCTNYTVYDLILAADPASATGGTILESYIAILDAAAHLIANA
jgi:hypothetical protein